MNRLERVVGVATAIDKDNCFFLGYCAGLNQIVFRADARKHVEAVLTLLAKRGLDQVILPRNTRRLWLGLDWTSFTKPRDAH
jgi:hypothetical protein